MFGYPEREFPDRGPLLAMARGYDIAPGDIVLAARFASVDQEVDGRLRLRQRFIRGREDECRTQAAAIAKHDVGDLTFRYIYAGRGDGNLFISGGASHEVTDTDPLGLDLPVLKAQPRAETCEPGLAAATAGALNEYLAWAHGRFQEAAAVGDGPPVNFLITKWAGPKPAYEPFEERWGMRAASLPDEEVVSGLMLALGFHLEQIENADPEADLRARLSRAQELFAGGYEFIHLHSKYPDPMSHDNEPLLVRDAIEALDTGMETYWRDLSPDPDLVTVLTTDHTTPSVWADHPRGIFSDQHSGEEAPIAIRGGNVRVDAIDEFGERAAAAGALGHLRGEDFMPVLMNAAERTNMWETRPTPNRRLYRPRESQIEPFRLPASPTRTSP
jgi:2,3-bisphosphoglycerate-independent phosphoglycerate mutase